MLTLAFKETLPFTCEFQFADLVLSFFWPCLAMEISSFFFFFLGSQQYIKNSVSCNSCRIQWEGFSEFIRALLSGREAAHTFCTLTESLWWEKDRQAGQGIRSYMGWRQGRILDAGWFRHRSYGHGQRYFLGKVGNEERIRWQAWREKEGLKAEHTTGVGIPATGPRQKDFEVVAVVPPGRQLRCTVLGWNTWVKEAGPATEMCLCRYRGGQAQHLPTGL